MQAESVFAGNGSDRVRAVVVVVVPVLVLILIIIHGPILDAVDQAACLGIRDGSIAHGTGTRGPSCKDGAYKTWLHHNQSRDVLIESVFLSSAQEVRKLERIDKRGREEYKVVGNLDLDPQYSQTQA